MTPATAEMIERVAPSTVFLHGTVDHSLIRQLAGKTNLIHFPPDRTRARTDVT